MSHQNSPAVMKKHGSITQQSTPLTNQSKQGKTASLAASPPSPASLADLNNNDKEKIARIVRELIAEKKISQELASRNDELKVQLETTIAESKHRETMLLESLKLQQSINSTNHAASTSSTAAAAVEVATVSLRQRLDEVTAKYGMSMGLLKLYQSKLSAFATANRISVIKVCLFVVSSSSILLIFFVVLCTL